MYTNETSGVPNRARKAMAPGLPERGRERSERDMIGRKLITGALFTCLAVAVPAMAQDHGKRLDHHDARVSARKHAGWQQTRNGSYVQPVGDPRYPGASPSGGAGIMTKDDMDSESFKPAAMVNPNRSEYARETTTVVRYEPYPQMTDE